MAGHTGNMSGHRQFSRASSDEVDVAEEAQVDPELAASHVGGQCPHLERLVWPCSRIVECRPLDSQLPNRAEHRTQLQFTTTPVRHDGRAIRRRVVPLAMRTAALVRYLPTAQSRPLPSDLAVLHGLPTKVSDQTTAPDAVAENQFSIRATVHQYRRHPRQRSPVPGDLPLELGRVGPVDPLVWQPARRGVSVE